MLFERAVLQGPHRAGLRSAYRRRSKGRIRHSGFALSGPAIGDGDFGTGIAELEETARLPHQVIDRWFED